ncbi:hypothetical protein INT47_001007, partial [Mucor saturninus]
AQKKISIEQETHLRLAIRRNPVNNYTDNWKAAVTSGLEVSLATYRKCIKEMGFQQCKITEVPLLTDVQKKKSLLWCKDKVNWSSEQWESVIWSDESMFKLGRGAAGVTVIRKPGEGLQERYRVGTLKFGNGSLMMWGCFHAKSLGPLVLLRGIIDQDKYIMLCLEQYYSRSPNITMLSNYAIPWIKSQCYIYNRDFIYQEDGAPIHTGNYAKWYKEKTMVTGFDTWPPNSPDLNPTEHI